jgi:hypothetical protein
MEFSHYKVSRGHLTCREATALDAFLTAEGYRPVLAAWRERGEFADPVKRRINKMGKTKKRVVYCFPEAENWVLKLLAFRLFKYDHTQPTGCYSFRRDFGAQRAIRTILATPGLDDLWCYKTDIADYFNTVPIPRLRPILADVLADDPPLLDFMLRLLTTDRAWDDGVLVHEPRGIMAGTPTSPFLANLYLRALDAHFAGRLPYARYSDDIILFTNSETELRLAQADLETIVAEHGLRLNPDKVSVSAPGQPWEFLGIAYQHGQIDLSRATQTKLKGKIRRKARSLRRWMKRKQVPPDHAQRVLIKVLNRKFFDSRDANDLTWARWFFPLLTVSDSLRQMDHYLQQYLRWLPTGRFTKANYDTSYSALKALGYRSLVHEFYAANPGRHQPGPAGAGR